jgi:MSHA biogenesis protein MshM
VNLAARDTLATSRRRLWPWAASALVLAGAAAGLAWALSH